MPKKKFISNKLKLWIEARKKFRLSHAQIQMARELGMNPKKLGGMANHKQEEWKLPLPQYIEHLYHKRFGKQLPDDVRSLEVKDAERRKRKSLKKINVPDDESKKLKEEELYSIQNDPALDFLDDPAEDFYSENGEEPIGDKE